MLQVMAALTALGCRLCGRTEEEVRRCPGDVARMCLYTGRPLHWVLRANERKEGITIFQGEGKS